MAYAHPSISGERASCSIGVQGRKQLKTDLILIAVSKMETGPGILVDEGSVLKQDSGVLFSALKITS